MTLLRKLPHVLLTVVLIVSTGFGVSACVAVGTPASWLRIFLQPEEEIRELHEGKDYSMLAPGGTRRPRGHEGHFHCKFLTRNHLALIVDQRRTVALPSVHLCFSDLCSTHLRC